MFSTEGFTTEPEIKKSEEEIIRELETLFLDSMKKLVPKEKYGIMFSGGVDSALIAIVAQKLNHNFICYNIAFKGNIKVKDLEVSKKIAKDYNLNMKVITFDLNNLEEYIKKVKKIVKSSDVIKISVGLVTYLACEQAKKDGIKLLFGGLGSEEIFAGYQRHRKAADINKECLQGLNKIEEKDISRDEPIADSFKIELAAPFLDRELIKYSLRIPSKFKINKENNKLIIRKAAISLGLKEEYSMRKKVAAQYGSAVDKALEQLAKKKGFKFKSDYLNSL